jgi:hypothetical protein
VQPRCESRLYKSQGHGGGAMLATDAGYTTSWGFDRAEPAQAHSVVNGGTALPVPLVVHIQCDGAGQ